MIVISGTIVSEYNKKCSETHKEYRLGEFPIPLETEESLGAKKTFFPASERDRLLSEANNALMGGILPQWREVKYAIEDGVEEGILLELIIKAIERCNRDGRIIGADNARRHGVWLERMNREFAAQSYFRGKPGAKPDSDSGYGFGE